jgi:hypothetical protein
MYKLKLKNKMDLTELLITFIPVEEVVELKADIRRIKRGLKTQLGNLVCKGEYRIHVIENDGVEDFEIEYWYAGFWNKGAVPQVGSKVPLTIGGFGGSSTNNYRVFKVKPGNLLRVPQVYVDFNKGRPLPD